MAVSAAGGVSDLSVDSRGISVVTTTRQSGGDVRYGTTWGRPDLAAAVPVHFHPFQSGQYLMLTRLRWKDATVGTHGPQSYSAHTAVVASEMVQVNPDHGGAGAITAIPTRQSDTFTINAAASRSDELFTVSTADGGGALISHLRNSIYGSFTVQAERVIDPVGDNVLFSAGAEVFDTNLVIAGRNTSGEVHLMRKFWARLATDIGRADRPASARPWEYWSGNAWRAGDSSGLTPLRDPAGAAITTAHMVSMARYRNVYFLATTAISGSVVKGMIYSAPNMFTPWVLRTSIDLGDSAHWPGGGLYLQSHLGHNLTDPSAAGAGVPYFWTAGQTVSSDQSLITQWGQLAV